MNARRLLATLTVAALLPAIPSTAQIVGDSLRNYDKSAPIDFEAARIEVLENENQALFTGNVEVSQGTLNLTASSVRVLYEDRGELEVTRLIADGGVTVQTPAERARASRAVYDVPRSIVTLFGDVELVRGTDRLQGEQLVIDLNQGRSSIGGEGRVRGTFTPSSTD